MAAAVQYFLSGLVGLIILVVAAFLYKQGITDKRTPLGQGQAINGQASMNGGKEFKYGLCSWYEDIPSCLYGACCGQARIADNFQMAGSAAFWPVVGVCVAAWVLEQALNFVFSLLSASLDLQTGEQAQADPLSGLSRLIVGVCLAAYFASKRNAVREKLGGDTSSNFAMDCICFWFCGCCSIIQDARQLDEATGQKADCVCKLVENMAPPGQVVGDPKEVVQEGVLQGNVLVDAPAGADNGK